MPPACPALQGVPWEAQPTGLLACDPHEGSLTRHGVSALWHGTLPHGTVVSARPLPPSIIPQAGLFLE